MKTRNFNYLAGRYKDNSMSGCCNVPNMAATRWAWLNNWKRAR